MIAQWFTQHEHGGFPIERAVLGSCDLSMLHIGAQKRNPDHVAGKPRGGAGGAGAMPKCPAVPDR